MQEIWKDIPGFENIYQASNYGNIRALHYGCRNKSNSLIIRKLTPTPNRDNGYLRVNLVTDGKDKRYYIHRLVATTFIPNPDNKPQVNHIDGDKTNNSVSNLEWVTISENHIHAFNTGLKHKKFGIENANSKPILQYTKDGILIRKWDSIADASRFYNIDRSSISQCLLGRSKSSNGYIWKYI